MEIILKYLGRDSWDRPVYEDENGTIWKDVDPVSYCKPNLCTSMNNYFDGEPLDHMKYMKRYENTNVKFIPKRDVWR